ncbi:MAG: hypothetical protein ABI628_00845 [Chloroflexota bacterium]
MRRASDRRRRPAIAGLLAVIALGGAFVACNGSSGSPSPAGASPAGPDTPVAEESLAPAESDPAESLAAGLIPVDPTLLDLLPATVNGVALDPEPDPEGANDPALVDSVDRLAQGILVDPASSDFVVVSVIALRPGVFDQAYFRSWRDSFDEGACSQSDGLAGHAQAVIAGRTVFIGRCTGGVTTYHTWVASHNAIVSISELLDTRLGEQVMAGLRP